MKDIKSLIIENLEAMGVRAGDSLMVHSSLNAAGRFENRAQIFIDAFSTVLGPSGTLLMPCLTYEYVTREKPFFDIRTTPSCVGALTEYFRCLPGTLRSLHPTHSVCAIGRNAAFFLEDHHLDHTPCGPQSPFRKLKETGGKILFMGCGLRPNTSMHSIEELTEPAYLFGEPLTYTIIRMNGTAWKKEYIPHNFEGYEQRYDRVEEVLEPGDYKRGKILDADSWLLDTGPLWEKVHLKMTRQPLYFVDKRESI